MHSRHHTLTFVLLLLGAGAVHAADWPQWRGPDRTGVSGETGLSRSWPEGGPPAAWKIDGVGDGYGSVSVDRGRIYVQGTVGEESRVFALDETTGRQLWATRIGPKLHQDKGDGPRATPTVEGDVLYALSGSGQLACLRTADGTAVWQVDIVERFGGDIIRWGISESPLIEGDLVLVTPGGRDATIAALDKRTGNTVWTSEGLSDRASYSSLIATDIGSHRVIVAFTQQAGIGVRAEDGRELWRYERPANGTANAATPIVADGLAFYSSSYGVGGGAVRLTPNESGVTSEEAWFGASLQNHHGGVVLVGDHLYAFFGRALTCVEFATGKIVWRARSVGKGSLTAADGMLFLVGENHEVGLAEATPEGYKELGRFEIEAHGLPSWAHPVVANGRLYIRNRHELTSYDIGGAAATPTGAR
jgi:outer membrane protein assembly factor BamB